VQRFTRNSWPACGPVAIPSVGAFAFVFGAGQLMLLAVCDGLSGVRVMSSCANIYLRVLIHAEITVNALHSYHLFHTGVMSGFPESAARWTSSNTRVTKP
jgi:hypothetical protein